MTTFKIKFKTVILWNTEKVKYYLGLANQLRNFLYGSKQVAK